MCFIEKNFVPYFGVIHLITNSNLPCVMIIVFNVVIAIHLQWNSRFRPKFIVSRSGILGNRQDNVLFNDLLNTVIWRLTYVKGPLRE